MGTQIPAVRYVHDPAHNGAAAGAYTVKKSSTRMYNHILNTPSRISKVNLLAHKKRKELRAEHLTATRLTSRQLTQLPLAPSTRIRRANLLAIPIPLLNALIFLAHLLAPSAAPLDGRCIAIIAVDPD